MTETIPAIEFLQYRANYSSGRSHTNLIGRPPNYWVYYEHPSTYDLTRPQATSYLEPDPRQTIRVRTSTSDIVISPTQTALVIIDMQNFFLSSSLGRDPNGAGNKARQTLLKDTIPAARRTGIQIMWLNWGLVESDLDLMPAAIIRAFGPVSDKDKGSRITNYQKAGSGETQRLYRGLGSDLGPLPLMDGSVVEGGRLLFKGSWNADLTPDLRSEYERGLQSSPRDFWADKNRMSGLWQDNSPAIEFLHDKGIKTLLFAGVNIDQCVGGSLTDAFSKGFDCILIEDAAATTSPQHATDSWIYNTARTYGFVTDSRSLQDGAKRMLELE